MTRIFTVAAVGTLLATALAPTRSSGDDGHIVPVGLAAGIAALGSHAPLVYHAPLAYPAPPLVSIPARPPGDVAPASAVPAPRLRDDR
jgi:hypothetical protein